MRYSDNLRYGKSLIVWWTDENCFLSYADGAVVKKNYLFIFFGRDGIGWIKMYPTAHPLSLLSLGGVATTS